MSADLYALLADLLEYPTPILADQVKACIESLGIVQPEAARNMMIFQSGVQERSQSQMEELYTSTFDMQPICYPYVGYALFGESYKRGAFLAKLVEGYQLFGYTAGRELPDHVPVILRFFSLGMEARNSDFGRTLLLEGLLPALDKMIHALEGQAWNPYNAALSALRIFLINVKEREMLHA